MCTETFLRLPEEKRKRFLDAAWEEFTRVPFAEASINKIVLRARIPRGSFYQYFADKEELFFYLLGGMLEHFYTEYNKLLTASGGDIFQTQLRCFDRVVLERNLAPLFGKGVEILRRNPVLLVQAIIQNQMGCGVWEAVRENVRLSMFRDAETARQTFVMSLVALVMTMTDAMARPEETAVCRQELLVRLDALKFGSLAKK